MKMCDPCDVVLCYLAGNSSITLQRIHGAGNNFHLSQWRYTASMLNCAYGSLIVAFHFLLLLHLSLFFFLYRLINSVTRNWY